MQFDLSQISFTPEQLRGWLDLAIEHGLKYGLLALYALLIWLIGRYAARRLGDATYKGTLRTQGLDDSVAGFARSIVRWLILIVVGIAILQLFGIDSTSLVAVLGAATLAVGLALQNTLSNFAAGVMLVIFRPIRAGHLVEVAGHKGTVKSIDMFSTELATLDNIQIVIPNSEVWSKSIVNYSAYDRRRVDITVGIDYGADIERASNVLRQLVSDDPRTLRDPEPFIRLTNLGESAVDMTLRVWCQAPDYWDVKFDLIRQIKQSFDKQGIAIPYPHLQIVQKPSP